MKLGMWNAMALGLLTALSAGSAEAAEEGGLAMKESLELRAATPDTTTVKVFERLTVDVDLRATYENPFDSSQVRVDAVVTPPGGESWTVPGFLYEPYERKLEDGVEQVTLAGQASWQVRVSFPAAGAHTITVSATDASGTVSADPIPVQVEGADVPGMVRRHPEDRRYFVTDRGETFYLVGANVCWSDGRGTFAYDAWMSKYADAGCNFLRVWLAPGWTMCSLNNLDTGFGRIDLGSAWRLDQVIENAERLGLRAMLCIDSFNILRRKERRYGDWENSPYVKANGGPLDVPSEYFTDETMLSAYRDRLRYLVARYGYSPSVFAWEFWNEVDIIDDYDSDLVTAWHGMMARHLRKTDPWDHLISTSHAGPFGDPRLDVIPELDFVQTHRYGAKDMAVELARDRETKLAAKDRPHFHGEYGVSHSGQKTTEMDPTGIHIHNGQFSSVGQLQAGGPMTWWWDSYIDPVGLYPIYAAFNRWIGDVDFVAQHVQPILARVRYSAGELPRLPDDDVLRPEAASWEPAPWNAPTVVRVNRKGVVSSDNPLSRLLHGVVNHADLHNPVTFELDVPKATTFGVHVEGVSGHGGAGLAISLDGHKVLDEDFADTDDKPDTITKHNRLFKIDLPKGKHTVLVENTGKDWFYAAYHIPWLAAVPAVRVLGVTGDSVCLAWIHNRQYTWRNMIRDDFEPTAIEGIELTIQGLEAGQWNVQVWDTHRGAVASESTSGTDASGDLTIGLPPFQWDIALRLEKLPE
ncbi:MAG: cellulase family glycosylhydrolase [bacterium]|nr:cellulase family glycosylhydrolase [bacterium]